MSISSTLKTINELRELVIAGMRNPVIVEGDEVDLSSSNILVKEVERQFDDFCFELNCVSCTEDIPKNECPNSKRKCGHHCNCCWTQDVCCWCEKTFGEDSESRTMPTRET